MPTSTLVTALLVRWAGGYVEAEDSAGVTEYGRIVGFVKLGEVQSAEQATTIAEGLLARRAIPPAAVQVDIEPDEGDVPFADFNLGDTIDCPDEELVAQPARVISLGFTEDDIGEPNYTVELAARELEQQELVQKWLSRMSRGALGGTVAASPVPLAAEPKTQTADGSASADEIIFSLYGDLRLLLWPPYTQRNEGCELASFHVALGTAGTTNTVVELLKNGTTIETLTLGSGVDDESTTFSESVAEGDILQVEIVTRGAGAKDLVAQAFRA